MSDTQLSGNSERRQDYESFPGRPTVKMPILIEQGYDPASVSTVVDRRLNAPKEVIQTWRNQYFWTADGDSTSETGEVILTLDAHPLRTINPKSKLYQGALQLSQDQLEDLKTNDNSIILSSREVEAADRKGLVKRKGKWTPFNKVVGRAVDHRFRGNDYQDYAEMVSEESGGSKEVLIQYFDTSKPANPHLRSVVVLSTNLDSYVRGYASIYSNSGFLAGVAPKAPVARENLVVEPTTLETQVFALAKDYVPAINMEEAKAEIAKLFGKPNVREISVALGKYTTDVNKESLRKAVKGLF